MSYAEQFYGMMGNQALLYADNLAWFGTESYVYKSADLMMKVIQNPVAMSNKVAAFYAYLWARAKGMKASDYFKKEMEISFYNTDLGRSFEAKIIAFNEDGSATFVSTQQRIRPSVFPTLFLWFRVSCMLLRYLVAGTSICMRSMIPMESWSAVFRNIRMLLVPIVIELQSSRRLRQLCALHGLKTAISPV